MANKKVDVSALRMKDASGQEYQAGSPAEWHNLLARGYTPLGAGPEGKATPQTAKSAPAKSDNKPVN